MRLQWQNRKGKATRGEAQTSQLEPQVQDMKSVGPLFVCPDEFGFDLYQPKW